jgi:hypothetical protein
MPKEVKQDIIILDQIDNKLNDNNPSMMKKTFTE